MTIALFKTKKSAEDECKYIKGICHSTRLKPIKIKFDCRDRSDFGMRGANFDGKDGNAYYILADSKTEVKSWKLYSDVL